MALTQISTKGIKDGTITNADINANAAIAGTKIDTDFGNQNLVTTGSIHATKLDISGITTNNSMDIMFSTNNDGNARTVAVDSTAGKFSYNPSDNRLFVDNINIPDNGVLNIGSGTGTAGDLQIYHDGSDSIIENSGTGSLTCLADNFIFKDKNNGDTHAKFFHDGAVQLNFNGSQKFKTQANGAKIIGNLLLDADNSKAVFGASNDLQIYHNGTDSVIRDDGTGNLNLQTLNSNVNVYVNTNELAASFITNGAVELYYDNSKKLETASYGTFTSGTVALSGDLDIANDTGKIKLGTNADITIFHNGTDSIIDNTTGELQITTDAVMRFNATEYKFNNAANNEKIANFFQDGACELYFDHSKKFQTGHGGEYGSFQALNGNNGWDGMAVGNSKFVFMGSNSDEAVGIWNDQDNEWMVKCIRNAETQLQYNGQLKLETTNNGIQVTGRADLSGNLIIDANSPQIRLDEADTTTSTRLLMSGGQFYLQTAASGQGTSTSAGVINLTGYNNTTASQINLKATTTIAHGDLRPSANNSFDLGTSSIRWRNLYTNDLHLSNEGGKNDVDGTYGSYTIQEGAEDLFLINRRNGKKYKFNLTEVS